jgi:hypothetical protein
MVAILLVVITSVASVIGVAGTLDLTSPVTTSMALTVEVEGTVHALNSVGARIPISGGLVEARHRPSGELASSTQTQAGGAFSLQLSPDDYNLTISASPPASNISPALIICQAAAFSTPTVMTTVAGVNVTLTPRLPERDVGGSCLTDYDGFCSVTVRPYYPLRSYSTTINVPEGSKTSIDVDLEPLASDQREPSIFFVTFTHPEYPVGPEFPIDHVLEIFPGQSDSFEGYMNSWPPVTTTVVLEGKRYGIAVNGYSYSSPTAWNLRFDAQKRLFNFTTAEVPHSTGGVAELVVLIDKRLLDGLPIAFVDNAMVPSTVAQNASHYFVRFSYALTNEVTHEVMVGGSNTVPENPSPLVPLLITVASLCVFSRRRLEAKKTKMRAQSGC